MTEEMTALHFVLIESHSTANEMDGVVPNPIQVGYK